MENTKTVLNLDSVGIKERIKQIEFEKQKLDNEEKNLNNILKLEPLGLEELISKLYLGQNRADLDKPNKKYSYHECEMFFELEFDCVAQYLNNRKIRNIYSNRKTFKESDIRNVIMTTQLNSVIIQEANKKIRRYLDTLNEQFKLEEIKREIEFKNNPNKLYPCLSRTVYERPKNSDY